MKLLISESQFKYIIGENIMDGDISLNEVWDHYIGSHFDWMLETRFNDKYDEQDMVLYFRFLKKYVLDMIEEDISQGMFGEDVKIGFSLDELNGSYDLFVGLVKKHMDEREEVDSEDDIMVKGVLDGNRVAIKRMGMRMIKTYYEDAKKSLNIFNYIDGKDRMKDTYKVEDDMITDRSAGYGFFGRDIIDRMIDMFVEGSKSKYDLERNYGKFYDTMFEYIQDAYGEFILKDIHGLFFGK